MTKKLLLILICLYQKTISPDHGLLKFFFPHGACIYRPTCSQYMMDAIKKIGAPKGAWLGIKRISRCHPWAAGGYDPITLADRNIRISKFC